MLKRQFIYKNLIELGFKRFEMGDGFDIQGFNDFFIFMDFGKIQFYWCPLKSGRVEIRRHQKDDIKNKLIIEDWETLLKMINFYKETSPKSEEKLSVQTVYKTNIIA